MSPQNHYLKSKTKSKTTTTIALQLQLNLKLKLKLYLNINQNLNVKINGTKTKLERRTDVGLFAKKFLTTKKLIEFVVESHRREKFLTTQNTENAKQIVAVSYATQHATLSHKDPEHNTRAWILMHSVRRQYET